MLLRICRPERPLVYACAGCSSAGQLTNFLAVKLDRLGLAEMSCISGIGGDVQPLLDTARTGRPIAVLDGCHQHCARRCLENHGIAADAHLVMTRLGARKRFNRDFDRTEAEALAEQVIEVITRLTSPASVP